MIIVALNVLIVAVFLAQILSITTNNHLALVLSVVAYVSISAIIYMFGGTTLAGLAVTGALQCVLATSALIQFIKEEFYYE